MNIQPKQNSPHKGAYLGKTLALKHMATKLKEWHLSEEGIEFEEQRHRETQNRLEQIIHTPTPLTPTNRTRKRRRLLNPFDRYKGKLISDAILKEKINNPATKGDKIAKLDDLTYAKLQEIRTSKEKDLQEILGPKIWDYIFDKNQKII